MTIVELKQRMTDENLDGYKMIYFNAAAGGCENSEYLNKEPDGTCTYIVMGDKGSHFVERRGLAEDEICEMIYKSLLADKKYAEWKKKK